MIQKPLTFLLLSFQFLGCATTTKNSAAPPTAESPAYSHPQQGFLWALVMNRSGETDGAKTQYLSTGSFQKKFGPFECIVRIEPEELNVEQKTIQQKAHLDCGEKSVNTICETNKRLEPFEIQMEKDGEYLKALLACDNGQNEVPPRTVFPGTMILSSTVLEPTEEQKAVRTTAIFPYQFNQNYAWISVVNSDHKILKVRTELTYEKPPQEWEGFPKDLKISSDHRSASYEKTVKSENGIYILGDEYHVAKSDPAGYLRIRVFIEEQLAEEFWLRFL